TTYSIRPTLRGLELCTIRRCIANKRLPALVEQIVTHILVRRNSPEYEIHQVRVFSVVHDALPGTCVDRAGPGDTDERCERPCGTHVVQLVVPLLGIDHRGRGHDVDQVRVNIILCSQEVSDHGGTPFSVLGWLLVRSAGVSGTRSP